MGRVARSGLFTRRTSVVYRGLTEKPYMADGLLMERSVQSINASNVSVRQTAQMELVRKSGVKLDRWNLWLHTASHVIVGFLG